MHAYKPRRPAQLKPEQIELIEGTSNIAEMSELAHITAAAIVPLACADLLEPDVYARIHALVQTEGVDILAESWVASPATTLPGILWRGYLLREWIRRFPDDADGRFAAARQAHVASQSDAELVSRPSNVRAVWDAVFEGDYSGDFAQVLRESARFTDFVGRVQPTWIGEDSHPLATTVTRRDVALLLTAQEFNEAEALLRGARLS